MAESQIGSVMLTTNSKILVTVDEALHDVLVVSYALESKLFQGVLLDSTKRFLPCRLPEVIGSPKSEDKSEEDKLYFSIRQRFTYFQEKPVHHVNHLTSVHKKLSAKAAKSQKMTVRLRPRQVLCSKCKSICNENSENVNNTHMTRSKKAEPVDISSSPRPLFSENRRDNQLANASPPKLCPNFVQRLPRPTVVPQTEMNGGNHGKAEEFWFKEEEGVVKSDDVKCESEENEVTEQVAPDEDDRQMVLRKKRSVGSMEDLWDETVFQEEGSKKAKTTPVIKISFGSQGEGTVLKIPAKVQESTTSESPPADKTDSSSCSSSKAAKKAMKKAKKEAKRKILEGGSPMSSLSTPPDTLQYRKHRHKVKHKKKHKCDKPDEEIRDKCIKQKLSINLKRVTSTTYEKTTSGGSEQEDDDDEDDEDEEEDEEEEEEDHQIVVQEVPNFPSSDLIREEDSASQVVTSCQTLDGTIVTVGDIVWGKIHGFPWWPGKVLNIVFRKNNDNNSWHAHVSWYGSTTSSVMPCDQLSPFLQTFKVRYNRRKKSAGYKEAIRQATSEASASNPEIPLPEGIEESSLRATPTSTAVS